MLASLMTTTKTNSIQQKLNKQEDIFMQLKANDTPPHSLKDSNVSPKMEIMKEIWVGVRSLVCNISKVEGRDRTLRWD